MAHLFGGMEETVSAFEFTLRTDAQELSRKDMLNWEKELIGVYISKHPLAYLSDLLKEKVTHTTTEITEEHEKQKVALGGTIKEARRITTKKGDTMCVVQLEDMFGTIGVTVFPRVYEETAEQWVEGAVVVVRGEVQVRRDEPGIVCSGVEPLKAVEEELNRKEYQVWITLELSGESEKAVSNDKLRVMDLYRYIQERPGRDHYELVVVNGEWRVRLTPSDNTMLYSKDLHEKLLGVLNSHGSGSIETVVLER